MTARTGMLGTGVASLSMPAAPSIPVLAVIALAAAALYGTVAPMVFALLATEVAPERRSQTLNLVYLPLYFGGIVGPVIASQVVKAGLAAPFVLAAGVYLGGGLLIAVRRTGGGAGPGVVDDGLGVDPDRPPQRSVESRVG